MYAAHGPVSSSPFSTKLTLNVENKNNSSLNRKCEQTVFMKRRCVGYLVLKNSDKQETESYVGTVVHE